MKITYIDHSGFLLEAANCTFLFDFVEGELPEVPQDKPFYVFASHSHPDHFRRDLLPVCLKAHPDKETLRFFLGKDIFKRFVPDELKDHTLFMGAHETYEDDIAKVSTLKSNDQGVAFIIEFSVNRHVYFAGDLNAWNWDGDEEDEKLIRIYHEELSIIKGSHFDAAFIPLDPRLNENDTQGITDFFQYCDADVIVPMHCWGKYDIIERARRDAAKGAFMSRILPIKKRGDSFEV